MTGTAMADLDGGRLPDFVIIGAMKAATTSLYEWLGDHPRCWPSPVKEPHFFSRDEVWQRGVPWYAGLFRDAPEDALVGEASASYAAAAKAALVAERMVGLIPDARLVYVVRHPLRRLRSHYRHEVQRGRERSPLPEAVRRPGNPYVDRSLYFSSLAPFVSRFGSEQICVPRFEDLVAHPASGWDQVLSHLDLPPHPRPATVRNVSAGKPGFTRLALRLWESGVLDRTRRLPRPLRRIGRAFLTRRDRGYAGLMASASAEIDSDVARVIWEDVRALEESLGRGPLWPAQGS